MRGAAVALAFGLFIGGAAYAQGSLPFQRLAGQWSGSGTIELAGGGREPIKCRAAYDVLESQKNLQLNIRCASESYSFDLRASATYSAGAISGSWSESTRDAAGTISGKAEGNRFEVMAKGPTFSAGLTLITRGDKQTVEIRSQSDQASVKGATINLTRKG